MASDGNDKNSTVRGYAIANISKDDGSNPASFQNEIGVLSSLVQRETLTQAFHQRGDHHSQQRGITIPPSLQQQRQSRWGKYSPTSPKTSIIDTTNQPNIPLPPPNSNNAPGQQETNTYTHHCSICNVTCNHETAYRQHLAGKKHQKKTALVSSLNVLKGEPNEMKLMTLPYAGQLGSAAQVPVPAVSSFPQTCNNIQSNVGTAEALAIAGGNNSIFNKHLATPPKEASKHEEYFCSVCNVTCNHELAYKQHLEGKRHQKQMTRLGGGNVVGVHGNNGIRCMKGPAGVNSGAPIPKALNSATTVTDPREHELQQKSSALDLTAKLISTQTVEERDLAVDNLEDSEEEGEIDEAKEDIEHLYNDFDEPQSTSEAKQSDEANADSDIDEMFGDDNDEGMPDQDIDEMFGDNDANAKINESSDVKEGTLELSLQNNSTLAQYRSPPENDADIEDMFGESSDDEVNCDSEQNTAPNIPLEGISRSKPNGNEANAKPKSVTFSMQPPISESKAANVPLTASEALAAARLRASVPNAKAVATTATTSIPLRSLLKKQKTSVSSSLVSRRQRNVDTSKRSYYKQVHPDQLWSVLRAWDFVKELNTAMRKERKPVKKSNQTSPRKKRSHDDDMKKSNERNTGKKRPYDDANSDDNSSNILPDSFDSIAHYQALWAPLLIEEAKAQLLSEVLSAQSSTSTSWMKRGKLAMGAAVKVELSRSARDLPLDGDSGSNTTPLEPMVTLHLKSKIRGASIGCPVGPNDLLLFVREASIVEMALRGIAFADSDDVANYKAKQNSLKVRLGFVGHALNRRSRSIDGLLVRASQNLWNQFSTLEEMCVIRIGSNVTALREFNALVCLDEIPLSKYLLNGKTDSTEAKHFHNLANDTGDKVDPLSTSGLPVGYRIFVKSKMNTSQLQAITASATEYGSGGFTLIKGPPGTGKSTTLVSILNALHLRQYQAYYEGIERIITESNTSTYHEELALLNKANKIKPRILVCAPSNAAIDNVVAKIINDRFVDGNGSQYSPNILRVGAGIVMEGANTVSLQRHVDSIIEQGADAFQLESLVQNGRKQLKHLQQEIHKLKVRLQALIDACPYDICDDWEVRIMEEGDTFRILFVNHKTKSTTFDIPPKVRPTEKACKIKQLPHYVALLKNLTKYVERHSIESSTVEQHIILQNYLNSRKASDENYSFIYQELETHLLNSTHIVLTTLGSAGGRAVKFANKFEVIVVDEAAQSSEMSTLLALQLGSAHAILVGDPQQLPATVFSLSGRGNKYDRSLFQRLEQCKHHVVMLNTQYRMDPTISEFPRHIFYKGMLVDGPNTQHPDFGGTLKHKIMKAFPNFKSLQVLDLDSREEREGTRLSNMHEAQLALHLYVSLDRASDGMLAKSRVAVITPYAQQSVLLHKLFEDELGAAYLTMVEISTVDAFQGRESGIVIFSCVRAGRKGSGIGFLSDVQRMNVALTRAKYFLFVIARRRSIMVNPYWRKLVTFAREKKSLIHVPINNNCSTANTATFPALAELVPVSKSTDEYSSDSEYSA